ncbi:MAG TPA: hypothetical protein DCF62_02640 [Porticoccaceae bacterium]|nr:hypothetical protein [Porticoccaceae bacterium]HCO60779.1 hypothetical protein [Porticoccaceae bacterium]
MITEQDMYFHTPTSDDHYWAETNYFGFYIPEVPLHVNVYVLTRQNAGVVLSSITVTDGYSNTPHQVRYSNNQVHLPFPDTNFDDYKLGNGLAIKCTKPVMDYDIKFNDGRGLLIDVRYKGLMEPYDIHDPDMDPLAASADDNVSTTAYAGHWDQSGRVTGKFTIDGVTYDVDCVSSMDHSWGERKEDQFQNFCWLNANFDNDVSIHCLWAINPDNINDYCAIVHGYVREGDQVYGLTKGSGQLRRDGNLHQYMALQVEDKRGKVHNFNGTAFTSNPWQPWPFVYATQSFLRWEMDGVTGWGEVQDVSNN